MKTILVPTDFSPAATNATEYAVHLAKYFDAKLVLVHAVQLISASYEVPFSQESVNTLLESSQEKLEHIKKDILKKYGVKYSIECIADLGGSFDVITNTVKLFSADYIVMGVAGEGGKIREQFIGSTTLAIARNQTTPTFIIPEGVRYKPVRKISFACDLDLAENAQLLYKTKLFCTVFDAELEIVNVSDLNALVAQEKVSHFMQIEPKLSTIKHKTVYINGKDVVRELEEHFKNNPGDMIILSPQKHNLLYYVFNNSVTRNLTLHSHIPILAIH